MKLNKRMKSLVKALIATASEPLKKQIEDLEYQVKCAEAKATNLEAELKAADESCNDLKSKNAQLSSELSKAEIDLSLAVEARDVAEDRANDLNIECKSLSDQNKKLGAAYQKLQNSHDNFKAAWVDLYEREPQWDSEKPNRQVLVRFRGKNKNAEWRYTLCSSVTLDDKKDNSFEHQWCYLEA